MEKQTRKRRILGEGASSQGAIMAALVVASLLAQPARAQARVPLPVAVDSAGVLSAIRAIDLRQLCRCPTLVLDSMVRRAPRVRMFEVLEERPAFALTAADVGRLRLARHRVVRSALRTVLGRARDTVFMGVATVPPGQYARQVLILAGPPNGMAAGYLVGLEVHRGAWRVLQVRNVF